MVVRERIQNSATTTLNGAINAAVTSIVVTDGSIFPAEGNYVIRVDEELMRVTARSSNTLTVTRGYAGSTAASHDTGFDVFDMIEKDNIEQYIREHGDAKALNESSDDWGQRHKILDASGAIITNSGWTTPVTGTNASDTTWGGHMMAPAPIAGIRIQPAVKTQPSTPYTVTGRIAMDNPNSSGSSSNLVGLCLRESSSGKLMTIYMRTLDRVSLTTWSSPTTVNAEIGLIDWSRRLDYWARFTNDGVNLEGFVSCDGHNWLSIGTQGVGTYLTPNQVGWFGANRDTTGHRFFLLSWLES